MAHNPLPYLQLDTAPAEEPLSLVETKAYLRVTDSAEDSLITELIAAARRIAEQHIRKSLVTQTWTMSFDCYAPSRVSLLRGPVQSISSVKIIGKDASETVMATTSYYLNAGKDILIFNASPVGHMVAITYVAGYGAASAVPQPIKQAMLSHIGALYDGRPAMVGLPDASRALYAPYQEVRL